MTNCGYVLLVEDNPDEAFLTQKAFKKGDVSNRFILLPRGGYRGLIP